jgi:RNA methyltransferase, TrmH family
MPDTFDPSDLPMLSSPQNQRVKGYVDLRTDGNVRREQQRFLLEGKRSVAAALGLKHVRILELIFSDHILGSDLALVAQAEKKNVPLTRVSKDVFKKIADVMTPQGIAAVVETPAWDAKDVFAKPDCLIVVACGLQDPGNVGTIIRSCEAAGASALVTLEHTADPFNAKVVRSTAAGLLALPILRYRTDAFLEEAGKRKLRLVATDASGGVNYRSFDWSRRPIAICIGNEGEGLSPEMEAACSEKVTIPLRGSAESLNAAVAASVLLFQANA